jgi:hypothetical protein
LVVVASSFLRDCQRQLNDFDDTIKIKAVSIPKARGLSYLKGPKVNLTALFLF